MVTESESLHIFTPYHTLKTNIESSYIYVKFHSNEHIAGGSQDVLLPEPVLHVTKPGHHVFSAEVSVRVGFSRVRIRFCQLQGNEAVKER